MRDIYKMKCGCVNNATCEGKPACAIHSCTTIEFKCEGNKGLEGRKAKCSYGDSIVESSWDLAFFQHKPNEEYDEYSFSLLPLRDKDGKRIIFKPKKDEDVMFTYKALTVGSDLSFILRGYPGCHAWDMTKNKVKPLKD